jgi:hypothetical protein
MNWPERGGTVPAVPLVNLGENDPGQKFLGWAGADSPDYFFQTPLPHKVHPARSPMPKSSMYGPGLTLRAHW